MAHRSCIHPQSRIQRPLQPVQRRKKAAAAPAKMRGPDDPHNKPPQTGPTTSPPSTASATSTSRSLYQVGIFTWDQLSRVDAETLQQITRALPSSDTRAWIEQARELAQANNRIGAVYDGPLPEDLTRIHGVDQVYEDELYAAGIFTFRQLAECAPDELASIIPAHLAGEELDFASWVAQADSLRDEYYLDEPPIL